MDSTLGSIIRMSQLIVTSVDLYLMSFLIPTGIVGVDQPSNIAIIGGPNP